MPTSVDLHLVSPRCLELRSGPQLIGILDLTMTDSEGDDQADGGDLCNAMHFSFEGAGADHACFVKTALKAAERLDWVVVDPSDGETWDPSDFDHARFDRPVPPVEELQGFYAAGAVPDKGRPFESLKTEARCKILWGEDPGGVRQWLVESGLGEMDTETVVREALSERSAEVRKEGGKSLALGILIALAGLGPILAILLSGHTPVKLFGLLTLALLFGLYKVVRGLELLLRGAKVSKSVTDL